MSLKTAAQWTMLFSGMCAFLATELLAVFSVPRALRAFIIAEATPKETLSAFFAFIFVFFALLVLFAYFRERNLLSFFFFVSLFFGLNFLLSLYFRAAPALLLSLALVLGKAFGRRVIIQNLALIPGMAGIGIAIGMSLTESGALILLLILSFYDIIAVYFTKHMVALFRGLLNRGVIPALIIPVNFYGLFGSINKISPGAGSMLLGTGDIVLPTIFIVAISAVGQVAVWSTIFGSLLGFAATEIIFTHQRFRRPMPALPPIATGTILGFLVGRLLT